MRLALTAITDELRRLKSSGVDSVVFSDEGLAALKKTLVRAAGEAKPSGAAAGAPAPEAKAKEPPPAPAPAPAVVLPQGDKATRWAALKQLVLDDPVCRSKLRPGKKVVLGVGNLDAAIMFVGEAPGAEEEVQGEPFVGPAGQLLNKMIGGMALSRSDVYIGNIMNWRPDLPVGADGVQTGNRPPTEAEMAHCLPFLRAQIEIVAPGLIVALGATAAKGLLGPKAFGALGEVRGRWHEFGGRPLMVTYHPSYILRNPTNRTKRLIWEDLLKVMERANLPISDKQRGFFL
ncbi:MAG: uracil-DNA glycosylase [Opitutaceae bacterium]